MIFLNRPFNRCTKLPTNGINTLIRDNYYRFEFTRQYALSNQPTDDIDGIAYLLTFK